VLTEELELEEVAYARRGKREEGSKGEGEQVRETRD
jgi:hypothetical protein